MAFRLFRHRSRRIDEIFLECAAGILKLLFHAGNIDTPFPPQEIQHPAAYAMHGEQAESHAAHMIIAFHGFDEPDGPFLYDIHDTGQMRKWHGLFKDQRLV